MTTTPYAKTTMMIDGAPAVSGAQLVGGGNVIQLLGESTVNWINQLWQIYEYPVGFALPTGWTNNNGIYECSLVVPPTFTIDPRVTRWGKYLTRLIVNNGLLAGVYSGPGSVQPLVDVSGVIQTKSPNLGLTDVAFMETNQFDPIRQWVGELKATLRVLDTAVGTGVATPPGGTNGQVQYNASGSFGGLPVLKWDNGVSRVVATSGGFEVSNPAGTFGYSIVGSALAADRILTLPLLSANDTVVTEAFIQTLTNKTFVASNNTITDTGASLGDLFYFNGTRYVRFPRGSVGQILTADAISISWQPTNGIPSIVFRPGAASVGIYVATWAEVEAFITANAGICTIFIDDSIAACVIPNTANTECHARSTIKSFDVNGTSLTIADGGRLRNVSVFDNIQLVVTPTATTPIVFDVGLFARFLNDALITTGVGTLVPAVAVNVDYFLYLLDFSNFDNTSAPTIPVITVAATKTLSLTLGTIAAISQGAWTLQATLVGGAVSSTLIITHDNSYIFTAQSAFLGTVTEQRNSSACALHPSSGVTGSRPTLPFVGEMYFDTTLNAPVWWDGVVWRGAAAGGGVINARRSSATTTTLVSGTDYHLSMTAPGQTVKLPTSPTNGETFRVKAAYISAGNTTIQPLSGTNTVEGAVSFAIGPRNNATLVFNADTSDWEDV